MMPVDVESFSNTWKALTKSHYFSSAPRVVDADCLLQLRADRVPMAFIVGVPFLISIGTLSVAIAVAVYYSLSLFHTVLLLAGGLILAAALSLSLIKLFQKRAAALPLVIEFDSNESTFMIGSGVGKLHKTDILSVRLWRGCTTGGESAQKNMNLFLVIDMVTQHGEPIPLALASNSFSSWEQSVESLMRRAGVAIERRKVPKEDRPSGRAMFDLFR